MPNNVENPSSRVLNFFDIDIRSLEIIWEHHTTSLRVQNLQIDFEFMSLYTDHHGILAPGNTYCSRAPPAEPAEQLGEDDRLADRLRTPVRWG